MSEDERQPKTAEEIAADVEAKKAEAAKSLAEAEKAKAEARHSKALAQAAEYEAADAKIAADRSREKRERELAGNDYHHVYQFSEQVGASSCDKCVAQLSAWHRLEPKCDITIVFKSPGGSVVDGMALFDYLTHLREDGHEIITVCSGYAASMAGILLQAGTKRIMGSESYILIHEISAITGGKIGEIEDDVDFYKRICERVLNIFVTRSGGKLSKAAMKRNWTRKNWWLDSTEALKLGIVDEVH
jgi:ATP-dependent Clp endopeptidase proteolytic subunit ClpP